MDLDITNVIHLDLLQLHIQLHIHIHIHKHIHMFLYISGCVLLTIVCNCYIYEPGWGNEEAGRGRQG